MSQQEKRRLKAEARVNRVKNRLDDHSALAIIILIVLLILFVALFCLACKLKTNGVSTFYEH